MALSKVRFGQRVAAIGGIVLLVSMFLPWYGFVGAGDFTGDAFEHPGFLGGIADILLIVACAVAIGGAVLSAMSRSLGVPVAMSAMTTFSGAAAILIVVGRMILQPGTNDVIDLQFGIIIALFAAGAILYGGWVAMHDDAPEVAPEGAKPAAPPARSAAEVAAPASAAAATAAAPTAAAPATRPVAPVHQTPAAQQPALASAPGAGGYSAGQAPTQPHQPAQGAKMQQSGSAKPAEWIAGGGAVVLLLSLLFFTWFSIEGLDEFAQAFGGDASFGAWSYEGFFGTIANLLILASCAGVIACVVIALSGSKSSVPIPTSTAIAGFGAIATVLVLLRMLFQPGPNEVINLEWGIYVAFLASVAMLVGGFLSMQGEGATFEQARDQMRSATQGGAPAQQQPHLQQNPQQPPQPPPPQAPPPAQQPPGGRPPPPPPPGT